MQYPWQKLSVKQFLQKEKEERRTLIIIVSRTTMFRRHSNIILNLRDRIDSFRKRVTFLSLPIGGKGKKISVDRLAAGWLEISLIIIIVLRHDPAPSLRCVRSAAPFAAQPPDPDLSSHLSGRNCPSCCCSSTWLATGVPPIQMEFPFPPISVAGCMALQRRPDHDKPKRNLLTVSQWKGIGAWKGGGEFFLPPFYDEQKLLFKVWPILDIFFFNANKNSSGILIKLKCEIRGGK